MSLPPLVTILMATYNGERYLAEQMDSLLAQSYPNWQLWVRDDGSDDNTLQILRSYQAKHPRIAISINKTRNKGACPNFAALFDMAAADASTEYIMFCDQDDIWLPEKIELTLKEMRRQESLYPAKPMMIYGNLELMDTDGNKLGYSLLLKNKAVLKNLVTFNYVLGCTVMLNREMVLTIGAIPPQAVNHDYWIALVASLHHSAYISDCLIRYRQHSSNTSGNVANNNSFSARIKRHITAPRKEIAASKARLVMLNAFYQQHAGAMSAEQQTMLGDYLDAYRSGSGVKVCRLILKYKMFKRGFFQSAMTLYQALFFHNQIAGALCV